MKKLIRFILVSIVFVNLSGYSTTYNFKKGSCLDFILELETKIHYDRENPEKFICTQSQYLLKFYVLDKGPEGEGIIAATSLLENATVNREDNDNKPSKIIKNVKEWLNSLEKDDFSAFVLDRWGNIIKGRMIWPDATCYHIPKTLKGLSIKKRSEDSKRSSYFRIDNTFRGIEKTGNQEFSVYKTENTKIKLKLLFDNTNFLPSNLEARYEYRTLRSYFEENLKFTLSHLQNFKQIESFLDDENMLAAIIQSSLLLKQLTLNPEVISRALVSQNPRVRITASRYIAAAGILLSLDVAKAKEEKNEIVRFNLAKGKYPFSHNTSELEKLSTSGSSELKKRVKNLLLKEDSTKVSENELFHILEKHELSPSQYQDKDIYRIARAVFFQNKEILHFGPNSYMLASGISGKRNFRYNVWIPEDYDPEENYPLIIGLAGGNGFCEPHFFGMKKIVPNHYILVCPDTDYGMWWEPDQILMFDDLLNEIVKDYAVDRDRIYLQGFSNGGIGAYHFGYTHPDRFAAVSPLMGYSKLLTKEKEIETEMSLNMKNTPILIIHGDRDRIIPVAADRVLVDFLRKNDIPHKYYEIKRRRHNITFLTHHKDVMRYFRKIKRDPAPSKVNLIVDNLRYNRNFWVRVDEKFNPSERARVKAEKKGNRFIIKSKNVKHLSLLLNDFHYDENLEYEITINRKKVFQGKLKLNPQILLESMANESDYARLYGIRFSFQIEV